ncbi:MAG: ABC transporter permease [Alphaproteobacteria bacterium]|nr:ABC transporter permease [Alphaproteobacteria bacterium]MBV8548411.1 ABC transporter permease [Alphaproteobacteria bacterium]
MTDAANPVPRMLGRLRALMLRHLYLYMASWPRMVEVIYWPIVNMISWGFTSSYLLKKVAHVEFVSSTMVIGTLLMEFFIRMNMTMLVSFIEEIWSRNLGHLFASPIGLREYIGGITIVSIIRVLIAIVPAILLADYLFGYSLFSLGPPLIPIVILLLMAGAWLGMLIVAMMLHYGLAAEWVAWMAGWSFSALFAPYYAVSVLPPVMQWMARALPGSYIFDSVKSILAGEGVQAENLWIAFALNLFYLGLASWILSRSYRSARRRGGLIQMGE